MAPLLILLVALPRTGAAQAPEPAVVTLDEAIRAALERHPAAVAAHSAVSSARADRLQAQGALLPNLTVNGIFANSSNQRFDQTTGQLVSESYTAQVQGTYEVFGGGRRFASIRASGADLDAAEARSRAQCGARARESVVSVTPVVKGSIARSVTVSGPWA